MIPNEISTFSTTSEHRLGRVATSALSVLAFSIVVTAFSAAFASPSEPERFVRELTDKALAILQDNSLASETKAQRLDNELGDCCDFATTAKLVLARNWKEFNPDQQHEFVGLFRTYLVATYRKNIDTYSGEVVEIVGGREENRGDYTVKTRFVKSGQNEVLVDYRLRKGSTDRWLIIDIIPEGISLVSNLRSQFQEIFSKDGVKGVLGTMRKKIAESA
ncbi:MAG: ABC transporter substrate-binding protein [Myxococcales bacterium]|nr:MAG: ABC transporter substrate-binding protein [Myxococcales bacterium]